jgi:subtilisin family serine protease
MSTSNTSLNQVLDAIDGQEMTKLMPLTGNKISRVAARDYKGNDVPDVDLSQMYLVSFSEQTDVMKAVNIVSGLEDVEFAEPNYIVHTQSVEQWGTADPLYCNQWHLPSVNMPQLWHNTGNVPNKLGHRPVIAILDTGIDINHPDLAANIWSNPGESENGADDDRNGLRMISTDGIL